MVESMDGQLREIVDYEEVHERVMRYNRESFLNWRERAMAGEFSDTSYSRGPDNPARTYEEIMANCYVGWSRDHEEKIESWLNQGD
jgi:hypothetical protein